MWIECGEIQSGFRPVDVGPYTLHRRATDVLLGSEKCSFSPRERLLSLNIEALVARRTRVPYGVDIHRKF